MSEESFLSRWSRRKQLARKSATVESAAAPPSPVAEPTPADTTAAEPELSAEEISFIAETSPGF